MPIKPKILNLMERAYDEEHALVSRLPENERSATGTLEKWTAKDTLSHLSIWKERFVQRITAEQRDEPSPDYGNYLELNDEDFVKYRDRSWPVTVEHLERSYTELVACVQTISEEDLLATPQEGENASGTGYWVPGTHTRSHTFHSFILTLAIHHPGKQNPGRSCCFPFSVR